MIELVSIPLARPEKLIVGVGLRPEPLVPLTEEDMA
jgi:hypothetical protein